MEEKASILATVVFLMNKEDNKVWLAKKTRKIGVGFLNGYGGKFKPSEDKNLVACSVRETKQECRVDILNAEFEKVAIVNFHNTDENGIVSHWEVHFYLVRNFIGIPKENKKDGGMIEPSLYDKNNLPLDHMMPADREFVDLLMQGKKVVGEYFYGPGQRELIKPGWYKIVETLSKD